MLDVFYSIANPATLMLDTAMPLTFNSRFQAYYTSLLSYLPADSFFLMATSLVEGAGHSLTWTQFVARHDACRRRVETLYLQRYYEHYNPSRVSTVVETLEKFRGQESHLWSELYAKYGPFPAGQQMQKYSPMSPVNMQSYPLPGQYPPQGAPY